jgi:addiction module HigA family antidote
MATTTKRAQRPRLPGEILRERYLAPAEQLRDPVTGRFFAVRGAITITAFAAACGVSLNHMRAVVNGRAAITAAMATRIAAALGTTTPEYWLSLQNTVDLYDAQERSAAFPRQVKRPRPMAIEEACAQ